MSAAIPSKVGQPSGAGADSGSDFRVVGYLPEYRVQALRPAAADGLTDLIFFSLEPTADGGIDAGRLTPSLAAKLQDLKHRGSLRLWVALGGWGRSAGFGPMATEPARRHRLVQALTAFCLGHHFDGADFDWEHPANAAEEAAYASLLAETQRAFVPHGLRVSVTLAAWQNLDRSAFAAVDGVNLMAYDHDGRHATPAQAEADVQTLIGKGAPPAKICLGLPFYGRDTRKFDRSLPYADIVRQSHPAADVDEVNGMYFNGPETIRRKTRDALDRHLGGVMIWEIGQDTADDTSLLRAICQAAAGH